MENPPKKLLIFGHSHTRNLGRLVNYTDVNGDIFADFNISPDKLLVKCKGIGGLHLNDLIDDRSPHFNDFDGLMISFLPQTLCLMIGCNDISYNSSAEEVSSLMESVASKIRAKYHSLELIVFTQILPRLPNRWINHELYNSQAVRINASLRSWGSSCPYGYYKWCKVNFPDTPAHLNRLENIVSRDGVHLNEIGYNSLYYSLRHVALISS